MVRKSVLCLACLALLAPAALAAAPSLGRFTGTTSQNKPVSLRTLKKSEVRFLDIRWKAPCSNRLVYSAIAKFERLRVRDEGRFTGRFAYRDKLGQGRTSNVTVRLAGRFVRPRQATGTVRGDLSLHRAGKKIGSCHSGLQTWKATLR